MVLRFSKVVKTIERGIITLMELNKEQQKELLEKLDQVLLDRKCPICEKVNWEISSTIFELRSFARGGIQLGGPVQPVISIMCQQCGHIELFNALKLGILKQTNPTTGEILDQTKNEISSPEDKDV